MQVERTDEEVQLQRVKRCRARLYDKAPGTFMMMGGLPIESAQIPTFSTDGIKIYVGVEFCKTLIDKEIKAVIIHESLHISLKHHFRRPEWCPMKLWNIACDFVINDWIHQSANYGKDFCLPKDCLWDQKFRDWSAEKVARYLLDQGWDEDDEDDGDDVSGVRCGDIMDAPEDEDMSAEEMEAELDDRIADAALMEKSVSENGMGGSITKIQSQQQERTTSSEHVRHWLQTTFSSKRRSLARPNRRFVWQKVYLPTPRREAERLHVCIDSSASVGAVELGDYRANIVRWAKELGLSLIRVAYADTRVHPNKETGEVWHDIVLDNGTGADNIELNVHGGGGTSFDHIFQEIERTGEQVSALVYMTDGYGSVSMDEPDYPVMWLSSGCTPSFRRAGKWGLHVNIDY